MTFPARLALLVSLVALTARADPTTASIVAASKLLEARNYSWSATVLRDKKSSSLDCKTEVGGYALVGVPITPVARRALGLVDDEAEGQIMTVFKDDTFVIKSASKGWVKVTELPRRSAQLFANLSVAYPHDEIAIIIANYAELKNEGAFVSGTLSETGAKLLLVKPSQKDYLPRKAKGTFRLWLKEGRLDSYEIQLEGTIVDLGHNRRELSARFTTTTLLKDVGTTKFDVPEEARRKLGS